MFLGMHIGIHDSNISLYKDGKSYYSKYERVSGIGGKKHGPGNFEWLIDTLKSWGVDEPHKQIKHMVHCTAFYEDTEFSFEAAVDKMKLYQDDNVVFGGGSPTTPRKIVYSTDTSDMNATKTVFSTHNIFSSKTIDPLLSESTIIGDAIID